jgi:hypothetical protein
MTCCFGYYTQHGSCSSVLVFLNILFPHQIQCFIRTQPSVSISIFVSFQCLGVVIMHQNSLFSCYPEMSFSMLLFRIFLAPRCWIRCIIGVMGSGTLETYPKTSAIWPVPSFQGGFVTRLIQAALANNCRVFSFACVQRNAIASSTCASNEYAAKRAVNVDSSAETTVPARS